MNGENNLCSDQSAKSDAERYYLPAIVPAPVRSDEKRIDNPRTDAFIHRRVGKVAAAALALVVACLGLLMINEHRLQTTLFAERAKETQTLVEAVRALGERLNAMESAKPRGELGEIRRSIGEMEATVPSSKEIADALAQISRRIDSLNREQSERVEKLSERLDRAPSVRVAELSARIRKLEEKAAAPIAPALPARRELSLAHPLKLQPNVSMEPIGSIGRARPLLQDYVILDARNQVALVEGRYGERAVRPGDFLPGAGRVERIERRAGKWVVLTEQGFIGGADAY
ncbi:MAG TPA: hypothetical protein VMS87_06655 [Roseiarcus sp.]|nr:hypothetical protein [Roseiarcus sp.]